MKSQLISDNHVMHERISSLRHCCHVQVIERDHPSAEAGFHAMLQHWVRRPSPPPSWSALIRALKCLVINRADIAADMEAHQVCCTIMCVKYIALTNS